jgi:hypothetical protein
MDYQDSLCSVLKGLYELIGEPVIKRLRVLGVPEQSRIWWCPTSVFCSLPLHAMGPIPSDGHRERYFLDLYIPSYTTSLSALIESHRAGPQTLEKPSLLLVAQPDDSLPGVKGEIKVVVHTLKSRVTVKGLISSEATPDSVIEGLRDCRFAHFACLGMLETGKPFEASFRLHRGSGFTLLDIVRCQFPHAEFAFPFLRTHRGNNGKEAFLMRQFTLLPRCSIVGSGALLELCGRWQILTGETWPRAFISPCLLAKRLVCRTMSVLRKRCGMRYRS